MALVLSLETSTKNCSVALSKDGQTVGYIDHITEKYSHSENLTLFISNLLLEHKFNFEDLDAIAVSKGPGSYTGLRIGVSSAKGLCYALNKPLIAISALESMAHSMESRIPGKIYCPMIDARRMEVYCALFKNKKQLREIAADIIDSDSFSDYLSQEVLFFGDGANKCQNLIHHSNATFILDVYPSADDMSVLVEQCFLEGQFEDIAYFEPYYLKDFVAGNKA